MNIILDELMVEIIKRCSACDVIKFSAVNKKIYELCDWEILYNQYFFDSGMTVKENMKELFIRCHLLTRFHDESGIKLNCTNVNGVNRLITLQASRQNLNFLHPLIGILYNLSELHLSGNNITELPDSICNLVNLKEINLRRNCLTKLPVKFSNLRKLSHLDLSSNKFTEIPEQIVEIVKSCVMVNIYMSANDSIKFKEESGRFPDAYLYYNMIISRGARIYY